MASNNVEVNYELGALTMQVSETKSQRYLHHLRMGSFEWWLRVVRLNLKGTVSACRALCLSLINCCDLYSCAIRELLGV